MTNRRPFTLIAAIIFLLMALVHLYRLVDGFSISIAGTEVGQGISIVALVVALVLSFGLFREARR